MYKALIMQRELTKTLKKVIATGAFMVFLSTCLSLGNYIALKKTLNNDVFEKMKKLRNEIEIEINPNVSLTAEKLQDFRGKTVNSTEEDRDATEEGSGGHVIPHLDGVIRLVAQLNKTLSREINMIRNDSELLNVKIGTTQLKIKLLEEKVNGTCIGGQCPGPIQLKGQANNEWKSKAKTEGPKRLSSAPEKPVYFSVALTKTLKNLKQNQLLLFDLVLSNDGGGYNIKSGKFKAPVAGIYLLMFFVEVVNEEGKKAQVNLIVDGQNKASAVAEAWHDGQEITSANAAVAHLTKGQNVWIQTAETGDKLHDIDKKRTSFTGVLCFRR